MTDTKPTLEEQIKYAEYLCEGESMAVQRAILASLRELQSIRSAELPVYPKIYYTFIEKPFSGEGENVPAVLKCDYDALKAYALKRDAELAALRGRMKDALLLLGGIVDAYSTVLSPQTCEAINQQCEAMSAVALKEGK